MKWEAPVANPHEANYSRARVLMHYPVLNVTAVKNCGNCNQPATVAVNGYPRCQPCANHLIDLVSTMRSNLAQGD